MEVLRLQKGSVIVEWYQRTIISNYRKSTICLFKNININIKLLDVLERPKSMRVYNTALLGKNQRIAQD